jgi:hypothetical protein
VPQTFVPVFFENEKRLSVPTHKGFEATFLSKTARKEARLATDDLLKGEPFLTIWNERSKTARYGLHDFPGGFQTQSFFWLFT